MVVTVRGISPRIAPDAFIADTARVIGEVELGPGTSVWFGAVVRGDCDRIVIGQGTRIQDQVTIHADEGQPVRIGDEVAIGHGAVLHGCTVGDRTMIGIGAIVLDGAAIGSDCVVGAGAVVPPGFRLEAGSLAVGVPARARRELSSQDRSRLGDRARNYSRLVALYNEDSGGS